MKKKYLIVGILSIVLIAGFVLGNLLYDDTVNKDNNVALAKTYDSIEELYSNSNLIIKAIVPKDYNDTVRRYDTDELKFREYEVKVKKVFANSTGRTINKNDIITLSELVEITGSDVLDHQVIKPGSYILFINSSINPEGEVFNTNNSANNLYKLKNNEFVNVIKGSKLKRFSELELEDTIRKLEDKKDVKN